MFLNRQMSQWCNRKGFLIGEKVNRIVKENKVKTHANEIIYLAVQVKQVKAAQRFRDHSIIIVLLQSGGGCFCRLGIWPLFGCRFGDLDKYFLQICGFMMKVQMGIWPFYSCRFWDLYMKKLVIWGLVAASVYGDFWQNQRRYGNPIVLITIFFSDFCDYYLNYEIPKNLNIIIITLWKQIVLNGNCWHS